jgi:hypothetical protein
MARPDSLNTAEEVWEEAHRENAKRPFLQMAENARAIDNHELAKTLTAMADFNAEVYKTRNGEDPVEAFIDSEYAKEVPLAHLPHVTAGFIVADTQRYGSTTEAQTYSVFHRGGHNFNRNTTPLLAGDIMGMLGLVGERENIGSQGEVIHFQQRTKMGVDVLTSFSPTDISVQVRTVPVRQKRTV